MGGEIWLDETYDSGVDGCPGAGFVIDLKAPPVAALEIAVASAESPKLTIHNEKTIQKSPKLQELPKGLSVLIVDDDMVLRKMLKRARLPKLAKRLAD